MAGGDEAFEQAAAALPEQRPVAVASWFSVDLHRGDLRIVLGDKQCWQAIVYAKDSGALKHCRALSAAVCCIACVSCFV